MKFSQNTKEKYDWIKIYYIDFKKKKSYISGVWSLLTMYNTSVTPKWTIPEGYLSASMNSWTPCSSLTKPQGKSKVISKGFRSVVVITFA